MRSCFVPGHVPDGEGFFCRIMGDGCETGSENNEVM